MLRAWRSAAATFNGAVTVTLESIISALILGLSRVGNESLRRSERLGLSPFLGAWSVGRQQLPVHLYLPYQGIDLGISALDQADKHSNHARA